MHLFWQRGYQGASLPELLAATGLSRSSFYDAFGTKRALLLASLSRYVQSGMCGLAAPVFHPQASRAEIEQFVHNMLDHALVGEEPAGCFVNNCATELATQDAEIAEAIRLAHRGLQRTLSRAVERGQAEGSITRRETPLALARFLTAAVSGINVAARSRPGAAVLKDMCRVTLGALDP